MLGTTEIIIIGGVVLLLFGASAIPKFFHSMGKAKSELEKGMKEIKLEEDEKSRKNRHSEDKQSEEGKR